MTQETFELFLDYDNGDQYHLDHSILEMRDGRGRLARLYMDDGTTGWFRINDAGKSVIYPTPTAKPYAMDSIMVIGRSGGTGDFHLNVDGTEVHHETHKPLQTSPATRTSNNITVSAVTNSTRNSEYKFYIEGSSKLSSFYYESYTVKLHFYRYTMTAIPANGVKTALVSNANPYFGDSVTYTATLKPNATFKGWYNNRSGTGTPVSTSLSFTIAPTADMQLYAVGELYSPIYIKQYGIWVPVLFYYKQNGIYFQTLDPNLPNYLNTKDLVTILQSKDPRMYLRILLTG